MNVVFPPGIALPMIRDGGEGYVYGVKVGLTIIGIYLLYKFIKWLITGRSDGDLG